MTRPEGTSPLFPEHAVLGARLGEPTCGPEPVLSYPSEQAGHDGSQGAALADLSGSCYQLLSGPDAAALARAALAGAPLGVGDAAFEASLTGDGGLASVPLALRTGDSEVVVLDPSERGDTLVAWLGFLRSVEQGGVAPFEGAAVEDASEMLVPLLLCGPAARGVLCDYVESAEELPGPGVVRPVMLDKISCLVAGVPLPGGDAGCFLVLVPAGMARVLWRSLLSFPVVDPVGLERVRAIMGEALPWASLLTEGDAHRPSRARLEGWGLLRPEGDYVGARGLNP